jgi:hypothetical protein
MSRRRKKKQRQSQDRSAPAAAKQPPSTTESTCIPGGQPKGSKDRSLPAGKQRRIEALIAAGKHREAVTKAKRLHKQTGSAVSEALLIDAYVAWIDRLRADKMPSEARALLESVWDRLPGARERLVPLRVPLGMVDELLRPLSERDLPGDRRADIEAAIRREVRDLDAIVRCDALPEDHRLRRDARVVAEAFSAVTTREVTDEEMSLPAISRRSPLAPWKALIRALAWFYRREDEHARRWLDAIAPGDAVRPLGEVLLGLLDGERLAAGDAAALQDAVAGVDAALRNRMMALDAAFERGSPAPILHATRQAVRTCRQVRPGFLVRLRQHLSIRGVMQNLPVEALRAAMGGPSNRDAYFWRLWARAEERSVSRIAFACSLWDRFLCHALHEGWLDTGSAEEAAVYLHMSDLLSGVPQDELDELRQEYVPSDPANVYEGQPPEIRAAGARSGDGLDPYFLDPDSLYERACAAMPTAEGFSAWLDWAGRSGGSSKAAERVALAWHRARPTDGRPLLWLYTSAEQRRAYKKALGYLDKAEATDGLNPEIRRARVRLLVATAMRHLKQGKPALVDKDLVALGELSESRPDLSGLIWAIRSAREAQGKDVTQARDAASRTIEQLSCRPTAAVVLHAVFAECALAAATHRAVTGGLGRYTLGAAGEVVRGLALLEDVGLRVELPNGWYRGLTADLRQKRSEPTVAQLRTLAEVALREDRLELAYLATGVGLNREETDVARFLLLRARSLPPFAAERRQACFAAVRELARQRQDLDLLAEAIDHQGRTAWWNPLDDDDTGSQWPGVLRFERLQKQYPTYSPRERYRKSYDDECNCDVCRRRRGELGPAPSRGRPPPGPRQQDLDLFDFDDLDDDDFDDDDDDFDDDGLDDLFGDLSDLFGDLGNLFGEEGDHPGDLSALGPLLIELIARHGRLLGPEELARVDPELYARMCEAMNVESQEVSGPASRPPGPARGRPAKRKSKTRRSKKRRGKR